MTVVEVVVGLAIAVGIAGIILPVLPGTLLVAAALVLWASENQTGTAWALAAAGVALLVVGGVVKYLLPGRRLKASVPNRTLVAGAVGAVVGFFVIPVVGVFVGFPAGVYVAERARVGDRAGASTRAALRAVAASILIELVAAVAATVLWIVGVLVTPP